jgi:hypothetical protein
MRTKTYQKVFLFVLIIMSINFFLYKKFIDNGLMEYSNLFVFLTLIISLPYVIVKNKGFVLPIWLISFSIFFSTFMAHYSWGQSYIDCIKATNPYLLWVYFFYLLKHKISISFIEKVVVVYGILYMFLYFYQFVNSSTPMFGWNEEFDDSRGIIRIVFPGGGLFFFTLFLALNKLTTSKENRLFWLVLVLVGLCIVVMQSTTQFVVAVFVIFTYHVLKSSKKLTKILSLSGIIAVFLTLSFTDNFLKKSMSEGNKEHTQDGLDYIRVLSGTYFLTEFSPDITSRVFGNGVPWGDASPYGKFYTELREGIYFDFTDVGIIGVYAMFGIFAVYGFVLIWIKSFVLPLPLNYYYLKYYLWFLLITCLTSHSLFNYNFLITNVIVIYCYQTLYLSQLKYVAVKIQKRYEYEKL